MPYAPKLYGTAGSRHNPQAIYYQHHGLCSSNLEPASRQAVPHSRGHRRLNTMSQNVTQKSKKTGPSQWCPCSNTRTNYHPHWCAGHPHLFACYSRFAARTSRNRLRPPPSPEQVVAAHQLTDFKGQMGLFGQNPHAAPNAQGCTISHKDAQTPLGRHPAPSTPPEAPPLRHQRDRSFRLDRALSPGTHTCPAETPLAIVVKAPASRSRKFPWSRCRASRWAGRPASAKATSHRIPSCERP